jgi:hypothetical protein
MLDLTKLLDKDGKPDKKAIDKLVEQLAVVPPAPGHVPAGVRQPSANGDTDWLRSVAPRRR